MSDRPDMDAPVTRREMHDALDRWATVIIEMVVASERRLTAAMRSMEDRLVVELGRATRASEEELTSRLAVVDEQYKDLPTRVTKLEAKVFATKRGRRQT